MFMQAERECGCTVSTNSQRSSGTRRVVSITLRLLCHRERTGNHLTRGRFALGASLYAMKHLARIGIRSSEPSNTQRVTIAATPFRSLLIISILILIQSRMISVRNSMENLKLSQILFLQFTYKIHFN